MANRFSQVFPTLTRYSKRGFKPQISCVNITFSRYYVSDDDKKASSSDIKDDEKGKKKERLTKPISEASQVAAKKKLLDLLSDIKVTQPLTEPDVRQSESTLHLTKPLPAEIRKKLFTDPSKPKRVENPEEILQSAITEVAQSVKGDPVKTELELKEKLISMHISTGGPKASELEEEAKPDTLISEEVSEKLMSSVKDVASSVPAQQEPVQSELAKRLLQFATDQRSPEEQKQTLLNLFSGLKVEQKVPDPTSISNVQKQYVPRDKSFEKPQRQPFERQVEVDLFGAAPLNIFDLSKQQKTSERNLVWEKLEQTKLKLLVQFAPANAFEEMILWTEQGRHWKFPIDNECDMRAEENVGFHEHVFLDQHLEGFPQTGPIRHFMELVVIGLSKNPFITVERKVENIEWLRQYFKDKEKVLEEALADSQSNIT